MTDFAPEAQILEMVKQEFLKIDLNINESITWDQGENILKKLFTSSSKRERAGILYDADKDANDKILFEDFNDGIRKFLNAKKDVQKPILEDEKDESERLADYGKELLELAKSGITIDPQMAQQIAQKHNVS